MTLRIDWLIIIFVPLAYLTDNTFFNALAAISVWVANLAIGIIALQLVIFYRSMKIVQRDKDPTGKWSWLSLIVSVAILAYTGWHASAWFVGVTYLLIRAVVKRRLHELRT